MNPEMMAQFVANNGEKPRAEKKPAPKSRRAKGLKQESEKQSVLNKRWNFIRHCFLQCQKKTDGFYSCMNCGAKYDNAKQVQLNHIIRRSRGGEYTPQNAELLGAGPGTCQCHEKADGNILMFSDTPTHTGVESFKESSS